MRALTLGLLVGSLLWAGCGSSAPAVDLILPFPDVVADGPGVEPPADQPPSEPTPDLPDGGGDAPDEVGPACAVCPAYGPTRVAGTVSSGALLEISGLSASRTNPGVLYVHNDSRDTPRFFALDDSAGLLGEYHLDGAIAVDWEASAVGPCAAGSCLYLGDLGDNDAVRSDYVLYRVREPVVVAGMKPAPVSVGFERFPFSYPDGSHNAETMMVHPLSGDVYIVTKVSGSAGAAYRFPQPLVPDQATVLEKVADLDLPACQTLLTGGDIHPCGDRMLLRSYGALCEVRVPEGQPFEAIFTARDLATAVPVAGERQGEAVAYAADGLGYFTVSEGENPPLNAVSCQ